VPPDAAAVDSTGCAAVCGTHLGPVRPPVERCSFDDTWCLERAAALAGFMLDTVLGAVLVLFSLSNSGYFRSSCSMQLRHYLLSLLRLSMMPSCLSLRCLPHCCCKETEWFLKSFQA